MLTAGLLIKSFGVGSYGYITSFIVFINVFIVIFNWQSWQTFIFFYEKNKSDENSILCYSIILNLITAIIASIVFYFLAEYLFDFFDFPAWYDSLVIYFSIFLFFSQTSTSLSYLRVHGLFIQQAFFDTLLAILRLVCCLLFSIYFVDEKKYLISYAIVWLLVDVLRFIFVLVKFDFVNKISSLEVFSVENFKNYATYTFWVNLKSVVDLPISSFDRLIVLKFLGNDVAGIFDVFKKFGSVVVLGLKPLNQVLLPEFSKIKIGLKLSSIIKYQFLIFLFLSIYPFVIFMIFEYPSLFFKLGLESIIELKTSFILYLLCICLINSFSVLHIYFMSLGFVKQDVQVLVIVNVLFTVVLVLFIEFLGLNLITISVLIQSLILVIYKILYISKHNLLRSN